MHVRRENHLVNQERNTTVNELFLDEQRIRTNIYESICNIPCCVYTFFFFVGTISCAGIRKCFLAQVQNDLESCVTRLERNHCHHYYKVLNCVPPRPLAANTALTIIPSDKSPVVMRYALSFCPLFSFLQL